MAKAFSVHLLDVGQEKYGDAILCVFGRTSVLIDGAHPGDHRRHGRHPSIPEQLADLLGGGRTHKVDLLVVSHAHQDHVGCLPTLVEDDILRAEAVLLVDEDLAFPAAGDAFDAASDAARQAAAAVREEYMPPDVDRDALERFLSDAARLEDRYREMISTLEGAGASVYRYTGRPLPALERRFRSIGLDILGPSSRQMRACSDELDSIARDAIADATAAVRTDAAADAVDIYRALVRGATDAVDAGRSGAAVNLQSIVTRFRYGGRSLLFSGDMQLVSGHPNDTVKREVERLVRAIERGGPYDLVKLGHHGSGNAFNARILRTLGGAKDFGICAGEESTAHPGRDVLDLLDGEPDARWARTDRNGLSTFRFGTAKRPRIEVAVPPHSDPDPNSDLSYEVAGPGRPGAVPATVERREVTTASVVEVTTTVAGERTTVTIDVRPSAAPAVLGPRADQTILRPLRIASGRAAQGLVFLTARDALADRIGEPASAHLLAAIRDAGHAVIDDVDPRDRDPARAAALVQEHHRRRPTRTKGVVILGGYDVVPAQRVDCLPPDVRDQNAPNDDPDDFVVWSDDIYGELGGDPLPELPVSRIPDGRSAALMFAAVQAANGSTGSGRSGIRNVARPFAGGVYDRLPAGRDLLVSHPTTFDARPPYDLDADHVYLMLHGEYTDGRRLRGEDDDGGYPVAMDVTNVPERAAPVVFCGACWGALIVDQPAGRLSPNEAVVSHKDVEGSIALSFLSRGATAFVGCTGAHYSPTVKPYDYYGGPLHAAFWRACTAGLAPAAALLQAKRDFAGGMPHGRETPGSLAIEFKILRLFTCLGLGW